MAKDISDAYAPDFGTLDAPALADEPGTRRRFRVALMGDFSGRANRGALETGSDLGARKGFKLDFDTMEQVIARYRTTLVLPVGSDGSAIEVELSELDELHPDELYDNMEVFTELGTLRRNLVRGTNLDSTIRQLQSWGAEFGDFRTRSKKRAKGAAAPANLRLSEFQSLIGDTAERPEASEASDLIQRIVGPYVVKAPDKGTEAMIAAVDKALSAAMSAVLHHPDFQALEAAWRSIEMLGRRVESSAELEVLVYDVAAEELAADLAQADNLADSGIYELLVEAPRASGTQGPLAAVFGLYTWEEVPAHAEILGRMARIAAHMDAPFVSAISTGFLGTKPEDRHPAVAAAWDGLRAMPEAQYLGLAAPRFMLRMPYGRKTDPIDRFEYEEFSQGEGMRSLLMANPALLVAVLLCESIAKMGRKVSLGTIMTLDDVPFHYMTDSHGDQVALPCTERLFSQRVASDVVARGYMPVLSIQGQNVVRLGSFQAVGGGELRGIWSGEGAAQLGSGRAADRTSVGLSSALAVPEPVRPAKAKASAGDDDGFGDSDSDDDDLDLNLDLSGDDDDGLDLDLDLDLGGDDDDTDLDALLAGFDDDDDDSGDDDDMDDELAALLKDL